MYEESITVLFLPSEEFTCVKLCAGLCQDDGPFDVRPTILFIHVFKQTLYNRSCHSIALTLQTSARHVDNPGAILILIR